MFPSRLQSAYLCGSFATDQYDDGSDIDILIIFKGSPQLREQQEVKLLFKRLASCSAGPLLDVSLAYEKTLIRVGDIDLSNALVLAGDDIRNQLPAVDDLEYVWRNFRAAFTCSVMLRKGAGPQSGAWDLPDPTDELGGYPTYSRAQPMSGTNRDWLTTICRQATALLSAQTDFRPCNKKEAIDLYKQHIPDTWGTFLSHFYYTIRLHHKNRVNVLNAKEQRKFVNRSLDFENYFLKHYTEALSRYSREEGYKARALELLSGLG